MTDKDDLIRRSEIFRDLLIKRILLRYALAPVVRFLSMNQMMMEIVRIVRLHLVFVCRTTSTEILVDMGGVVVDDDIIGLGWAGSTACEPGPASSSSLRSRETSSKPRSLIAAS